MGSTLNDDRDRSGRQAFGVKFQHHAVAIESTHRESYAHGSFLTRSNLLAPPDQ
jgi:hypothetical protein